MTVGIGPIATEERPVSRGEASSDQPRLSSAMSWARRWFEPTLLAAPVALLTTGGVAWAAGSSGWAEGLWAAATVSAVVPAAAWVVAALLRRTLGADLIAVLALLGTLAVRESRPNSTAAGEGADAAANCDLSLKPVEKVHAP